MDIPSRENRDRAPAGGLARPAATLFAALFLVSGLPSPAAAQAPGAPALGGRGVGLEAAGGVVLAGGGLAAVADPGLSAGGGVSVPVGPNVNIRLDGGLELPARDASAAPLINFYSGLAGLEYVAQQDEPGHPPVRTALALGAGLSVVEAVEMPVGAPAGATFSESYLTLAAGARLGYPVTSGFEIYLAPRVKWLDIPEDDWSRLTTGLGVPAPGDVWLVPLRAGLRIGL